VQLVLKDPPVPQAHKEPQVLLALPDPLVPRGLRARRGNKAFKVPRGLLDLPVQLVLKDPPVPQAHKEPQVLLALPGQGVIQGQQVCKELQAQRVPSARQVPLGPLDPRAQQVWKGPLAQRGPRGPRGPQETPAPRGHKGWLGVRVRRVCKAQPVTLVQQGPQGPRGPLVLLEIRGPLDPLAQQDQRE
jgi:hypothetical protein